LCTLHLSGSATLLKKKPTPPRRNRGEQHLGLMEFWVTGFLRGGFGWKLWFREKNRPLGGHANLLGQELGAIGRGICGTACSAAKNPVRRFQSGAKKPRTNEGGPTWGEKGFGASRKACETERERGTDMKFSEQVCPVRTYGGGGSNWTRQERAAGGQGPFAGLIGGIKK